VTKMFNIKSIFITIIIVLIILNNHISLQDNNNINNKIKCKQFLAKTKSNTSLNLNLIDDNIWKCDCETFKVISSLFYLIKWKRLTSSITTSSSSSSLTVKPNQTEWSFLTEFINSSYLSELLNRNNIIFKNLLSELILIKFIFVFIIFLTFLT
jgi:hypothetical protein